MNHFEYTTPGGFTFRVIDFSYQSAFARIMYTGEGTTKYARLFLKPERGAISLRTFREVSTIRAVRFARHCIDSFALDGGFPGITAMHIAPDHSLDPDAVRWTVNDFLNATTKISAARMIQEGTDAVEIPAPLAMPFQPDILSSFLQPRPGPVATS